MSASHPKPWRRGGAFGPGLRRRLDRNDRARFQFLLRAHARAGRLSPKEEWVGTALLKRHGADGQCDPSHQTLASDASCSVRTVGRALAAMRALALLRWVTRLVRNGWRTEQTSNAYELVPTAPEVPPGCDGQHGRPTKKIRSSLTAASKITGAADAQGPSEGSDEWGQWNAERQRRLLMA